MLTLDVTSNKHGKSMPSGSAEQGTIFNDRCGDIMANDLKLNAAKVVIKGSGNFSVHADDELYADLNGSGDLLLTGFSRLKRLSVIGAGTFTLTTHIPTVAGC